MAEIYSGAPPIHHKQHEEDGFDTVEAQDKMVWAWLVEE